MHWNGASIAQILADHSSSLALALYCKILLRSLHCLGQAHFKTHKPVKTEAQKQAQRQAILAQVPGDQRKSITDSLMGQALEMGMVCSAH